MDTWLKDMYLYWMFKPDTLATNILLSGATRIPATFTISNGVKHQRLGRAQNMHMKIGSKPPLDLSFSHYCTVICIVYIYIIQYIFL